MSARISITLAFIIICCSGISLAQDRCAITYVQKLQNRPKAADDQFESWLDKLKKTRAQGLDDAARTQSTFQIPVVVHVIHNGETDPTNIPDEQIISQINVLNKDFNRQNADASNTPATFLDAAGSIDIEFVLAKRTPEGLATNGINRIRGPKTSWTVGDNYSLKSLSYWPAEDYLNIWVCNITDYLGYAQFPQTTLLDGLESASTNRLTDGVVIAYDAFGSIDDGDFDLDPKYNRGRTATHEIGHFFGLRHISGDDQGACGGDGDYVDDTPDQGNQNYNCPSHPLNNCGSISMFQNYLDYTNDACMNLFTKGQIERMQIIIENSPRRKSLLTSKGGLDPEPVANDLGLRQVLQPLDGECAGTPLVPKVEIRNYGNNVISSAQIQLLQDNVVVETINYSGSLNTLQSNIIEFSSITIAPGSSVYTFQIVETNGTADGNGLNNALSKSVYAPENTVLPLVEPFHELPADWVIQNPDDFMTWQLDDVPLDGNNNKAMSMKFFDYEDNEGELDALVTPVLDLTDAPFAVLLFSISHARFQTSNDGLRVVVLNDCSSDLNSGEVIYEKVGADLATQPATNTGFKPLSNSAWRNETVNLDNFVGQRIRLAFIGINDWGNNLYLDNVRIFIEDFVNIGIAKAISPAPVHCEQTVTPRLLINNLGTPVSSFELECTINGITTTQSVSGLSMASGESIEVDLQAIDLTNGTNTVSYAVKSVNGFEDGDPSDNVLTYSVLRSDTPMPIPFREDFEDQYEHWASVNPNGGMTWESKTIDGNVSLVHKGFSNQVPGDEVWLVSSPFNLSESKNATLYFDYSYRTRNTVSDKLEIRASLGCDLPFDEILATYEGSTLSDQDAASSWTPSEGTDWQSKYVSLAPLVGESEVRIAIVAVNNNANNLYLDNLELLLSSEGYKIPIEGEFSIYPNPNVGGVPTNIGFNLPELQDVKIEIIDPLGKLISEQHYTDVLNQIIDLQTDHYMNGLYLVRIAVGGKVYVQRFILSR